MLFNGIELFVDAQDSGRPHSGSKGCSEEGRGRGSSYLWCYSILFNQLILLLYSSLCARLSILILGLLSVEQLTFYYLLSTHLCSCHLFKFVFNFLLASLFSFRIIVTFFHVHKKSNSGGLYHPRMFIETKGSWKQQRPALFTDIKPFSSPDVMLVWDKNVWNVNVSVWRAI